MFIAKLRLFSRKSPRKKPSCVRKSQRQRVARQRVAGPKKDLEAHPLSKLCVQLHTLDCLLAAPRKETQLSQKITAPESRKVESRRPKKGLEAHPLSEPCVQFHTLDCFAGSPQERNPVASENRSVGEPQCESCRPKQPFCTSQCRIFRCCCSSPSVPFCPMAENARKIGFGGFPMKGRLFQTSWPILV